jgi:enoyl-CoA hydratase/carnithine racemase
VSDTSVRLSLVQGRNDTLSPMRVTDLTEQLDRAAPLVVVEGAPGRFCSGLDLTASVGGPRWEGLQAFARLLAVLDRQARPVVALVDGPALGGGVAVAAVADLVIATARARFALPEVVWGLIPAIALPYIARRVGLARARLLALGRRPLDVDEALEWGLVDEITCDPEATLRRHERRFARMDPAAMGKIKALVAALSVPDGVQQEAIAQFHALLDTNSTRQRLHAFRTGDAPWLANS